MGLQQWLAGVLVLVLMGCQPDGDKIIITGSSTIAPLMADLAERSDAALVVVDKVASTPSRYPRRSGALTKRPLSASRG